MKRFVCHINSLLMRIGKPLAVTGIVFILVILMGTCGDDELASFEETDEIEYTDVEYAEDGKGVTLYLDGVGVPKSRAQRAITKDIAQTAFDFIEVVFVNGTFPVTPPATPVSNPNVARASWILGQPANIVNVDRGTGTTGVNYQYIYPNVTNDVANGPAACMFVGRAYGKDKVLMGVGKLTGTNGGSSTTIDINTTSVKFTIAALQSGLLVGNETAPLNGVVTDSFTYYDTPASGGFSSRVNHSFRVSLGGVSYPVYLLPTGTPDSQSAQDGDPSATVTYATYKFLLADGYSAGIRYADSDRNDNRTGNTKIERRMPRYADGFKYREPRNLIDTGTRISLRTTYGYTAGYQFQGSTNTLEGVRLRFSSETKPGIISFNIEISVYMVNKDLAGRNGNLAAEIWKIRSGVGSEYYSLDDGVSRGGCVLMFTTNAFSNVPTLPSSPTQSDLDARAAAEVAALPDALASFNKIEWTWFKGF